MGETRKCVSSISHTLELQTALKIKLRPHWLTARLSSTSKAMGLWLRNSWFPLQRLTETFREIPTEISRWGKGRWSDKDARKRHRIHSFAWIRSEAAMVLIKKGKKRRTLKLKQTTEEQLQSISCNMLFLSQGLFRCTSWTDVGNDHESKPAIPAALGLMRSYM